METLSLECAPAEHVGVICYRLGGHILGTDEGPLHPVDDVVPNLAGGGHVREGCQTLRCEGHDRARLAGVVETHLLGRIVDR